MKIRRLAFFAILALSCFADCSRRVPGTPQSTSADSIAAIRSNNLGVAEMNRGRPGEALGLFTQAVERDPDLFAARLNQGIALLNTQAYDRAREVLLDATRRKPDSARAWYNLGILYRNLAEAEAAIDAFEHAAELDAGDADARYFLGQLHAQVSRYDMAILWFERCLALDSLHLSAEFGLARAYQLSGNADAARQHLARFDELTRSGLGKPISLAYGEQGPYSTAEPVAGVSLAPTTFSVRFNPFSSDAGIPFSPGAPDSTPDRILPLLGGGACFIRVANEPQPELVLTGGAARVSLLRNIGRGSFEDVTARSGLQPSGQSLGCAVGDYDNDGKDDLVLGMDNGIAVYQSQSDGTFRDVTAQTGIRLEGFPLGLSFVDYDHDGDVDLYVSRFQNFQLGPSGAFDFPLNGPAVGGLLWRNNGNGTFTDGTQAAGVAGGAPGIGALPVDFNNDRAVDLLLTAWKASPSVLMNAREGPFRSSDAWKSPFPAPAAGAVALDFNKDGWMDLAFTHWGQPGLSLWKNLAGGGFERVTIPDPGWNRGWGVTAVDVDNDGWVDIVAVGETNAGGRIALLRNLGDGQFSDSTQEAGLRGTSLVRPRAIVAADTDGDGDDDLLITQNGGSPVTLRNDGGSQRRSIRLAFRGLNDNRSGIGTKVEVYAGALRQKWEVPSASGYLSQGPPEILVGIDDAEEADIVRLLWPTGVPQDEVQLKPGERHVLNEIDRRGSSCPVVFVWNGERYEFVSDMIGPGIVGEWVGPGERNLPDPTEYLKIDGRRVQLKDGRISFRFAEVMEEITYLDHVRLLAIDHPDGVVVNPNEYFASQPPFPEFKVIRTLNARPPVAAVDDQGRNVLPLLMQQDRQYVAGFGSLAYPGFAEMHYLEMDLGVLDPQAPLRLIMHGFIDYFTVTSIFAAHQGDVHAVVPFLEVSDGAGGWKRVSDDIGFPAGLARTMVADLSGLLPPGASRIRIGTNLKIYWDQILVDTTPQTIPYETHEVPLAGATFAFRGYPRKIEGSVPGDVSYIHEESSGTGPYAKAAGYYTAYGDVRRLVEQPDDRFVVLGSGDEVSLEFDPSSLEPVRPGWSRDYFLYADGFAKDMDFYSAYSSSVEPLPFHAMAEYSYNSKETFPLDGAHLDYRLQNNTRYEDGKSASSYRFRYPVTGQQVP